MPIALIFGITGQDGSYLAELLLEKGYTVHGVKRRVSNLNTQRIDHLYQPPLHKQRRLVLHYGDLSDTANTAKIIKQTRPDEIYNLAAMSHVKVSFELPEYTSCIDGLGTLRILESIDLLGLSQKVKFYQAGSSEMFGKTKLRAQDEATPFQPLSPYASSKVFAHHITQNFRDAYGLFACNGILFNHESPRRGETFVSRKITRAAVRIAYGQQDQLVLGNLKARRDWGHAKDYVRAMWLMMQQDKPDDFVIGSGQDHSVQDFCDLAFSKLGIELEFTDQQGKIKKLNQDYPHLVLGQVVVTTHPMYLRPNEVPRLKANPSKAKELLGWEPQYSFKQLVHEMIDSDLKEYAEVM